jgi:hypothetical protein
MSHWVAKAEALTAAAELPVVTATSSSCRSLPRPVRFLRACLCCPEDYTAAGLCRKTEGTPQQQNKRPASNSYHEACMVLDAAAAQPLAHVADATFAFCCKLSGCLCRQESAEERACTAH